MGGTQSTATQVSVNNIATKAATNVILKCSNSITQSQSLDFGYVAGNFNLGDVNMSLGASIDMQCVMSAETRDAINTGVATAVGQMAESKGEAILSALGSTKSNVNSTIYNNLTNETVKTTEQDVVNQIKQTQSISVGYVGGSVNLGNVNMEAGADIVAKALMATAGYTTVLNDVQNKIDQATKTEEKNPVSSILDSVGGAFTKPFAMAAAAVAVAIVVLFIFYMIMRKK